MSAALLRLLVIHEDPSVRRQVSEAILPLGEVFTAGDLESARAAISFDMVDVALLDPRLASSKSGLPAALPLIALGPVPDGVAGGGAAPGPFHAELALPPDPRVCALLARSALERRRLEMEVRRLRANAAASWEIDELMGHSPAMAGVRRAIRAIAGSDAPVLIRGETGTGRAVAGRAVHAAGPRRDGPFVSLLLSAFSPLALETELGGRDRARGGGRVESAHRGTLLLRDLEALPASLQEPLLRLARSGVWAPPGSSEPVIVDVRLMATAGPGLDEAVSANRFREDLLQSLEAVTLHIPPLRERRQDIPVLAGHFLGSLRRPGEGIARRFSQDALEVLSAQAWRGNVRELRHVVESVALHSDAVILGRRDLPRVFTKQPPDGSLPVKLPDGGLVIEHEIASYEKAMLALALERAAGRRSEAAALLGLNKDQMKYLCRKHGL